MKKFGSDRLGEMVQQWWRRPGFWRVSVGIWVAMGLGLTASAQNLKPTIMITVRLDQTGSNLVEVTPLDGRYPRDLLQSQCEKIGRYVGSAIRGYASLETNPQVPSMNFLKARFAVDGLIDRERGRFGLEPIAKAFVGAPDPFRTETITIHFQGEVPRTNTLKTYSSDEVAVAGVVQQNPTGIEYRVHFLTQDPAKIKIPSEYIEPAKPEANPKPEPKSSGSLIWILTGIGAISAGLLVYFLVMSTGKDTGQSKVR